MGFGVHGQARLGWGIRQGQEVLCVFFQLGSDLYMPVDLFNSRDLLLVEHQ